MNDIPSAFYEVVAQGPIFQRGSSSRFGLILQGTYKGRPTVLFEFSYTVRSGKHRRTERYLFCAVNGEREVPSYVLRPESWIDVVGGWIGFQDIDLPDEPEFSRRFHLSGSDAPAVRALFSREKIRQLIEIEGINLIGMGRTTIVLFPGEKLYPETFAEQLQRCFSTASFSIEPLP